MPFKSPKQQKWFFANHPDIARRWKKKYGYWKKVKGKWVYKNA